MNTNATTTTETALIAALTKALAASTFVVETVAHLQGKECELLPMAEHARSLIDRAEAHLTASVEA